MRNSTSDQLSFKCNNNLTAGLGSTDYVITTKITIRHVFTDSWVPESVPESKNSG